MDEGTIGFFWPLWAGRILTISATVKTPSPSPTTASLVSGVSGIVTIRLLGELLALELARLWLSGGRAGLAGAGLGVTLQSRSTLILASSKSAMETTDTFLWKLQHR